MQICRHLRCHYAEINAQRITIRLRFISAKFLASAPPICKSFGGKEIKSRKDKNGNAAILLSDQNPTISKFAVIMLRECAESLKIMHITKNSPTITFPITG